MGPTGGEDDIAAGVGEVGPRPLHAVANTSVTKTRILQSAVFMNSLVHPTVADDADEKGANGTSSVRRQSKILPRRCQRKWEGVENRWETPLHGGKSRAYAASLWKTWKPGQK